MSNVQGQIDRINGEVSAQKALISQIATALEGKAGGGGAELKSASGTAQVEAITVNGTTYYGVKVTGLDFTPCAAVVAYSGSLYNVNRYGIMADADGNIIFALGYNYSNQSTSATLAARCSVGDGFFSMPIYTSNLTAGSDRQWIAVGI